MKPPGGMRPRDPDEDHRVSTPLELLFDLCFVVAVAQAAAELHHAVAEGHAGDGVVGYVMVVLRHLVGLDELHLVRLGLRHRRRALPARHARPDRRRAGPRRRRAARVRAAQTSTSPPSGYVIMRVGAGRAVAPGRAGRSAAPADRAALRARASPWCRSAGCCGLLAAAAAGLAALARAGRRRAGRADLGRAAPADDAGTPHHIAERYGLVHDHRARRVGALAATSASRPRSTRHGRTPDLLAPGRRRAGHRVRAVVAVLRSSRPSTAWRSSRAAFVWGYGHQVIFASAAAVGAGLAVAADYATGRAPHL